MTEGDIFFPQWDFAFLESVVIGMFAVVFTFPLVSALQGKLNKNYPDALSFPSKVFCTHWKGAFELVHVALNLAWKRLPSTRWIVSRGRSCTAPLMMHGQIAIVYHFRIICHSFVYKCSSYFIPYCFFLFLNLAANWIWLAKRWFTTPADWSENGIAVATNHPWKWVCNAYPPTFLALTVLTTCKCSLHICFFFLSATGGGVLACVSLQDLMRGSGGVKMMIVWWHTSDRIREFNHCNRQAL